MPSFTPQQFVDKWKSVELKERSASQEHFLDLCRLVDHPSPAEADPKGEWFAFEYGADKTGGGGGFADVWKKAYFGWEYKGRHADLDKAYQQLLRYRESLQNPPLLVVCDLGVIVVHTNFTNTVKQMLSISYDDLLTTEGMKRLRAIFHDPQYFRVAQTTDQVTETAAKEFAHLADLLRARGIEAHEASHFLIRILFCLFAEDVNLLPDRIMSTLVDELRHSPSEFTGALGELFEKMAKGGRYGAKRIKHFNGRLFDDAKVFDLDREMIGIIEHVARLDWSSIEPAIFGTLFERSLDPSKRAQLGAHYTSRADIELIVEPVLMDPLHRRWDEVRAEVDTLVGKQQAGTTKGAKTKQFNKAHETLRKFSTELSQVTVLDPACGSGNFLYVALRKMLDLEKEVINYTSTFEATTWSPQVSPLQLRGIELDAYAHELAQATIWIGYIQWLNENGFGTPAEPILHAMDNIENKDAVIEYSNGRPVEPPWPNADVIIGNPPFLGDKRMRQELGAEAVADLRELYGGRVSGGADLVAYWFERARAAVASKATRRVGLLATNSIRFGSNRLVLDRIIDDGQIFIAWSDRPWTLDGAAVRVSIVGFDDGTENDIRLDGVSVASIHSNLTSQADVTKALRLPENSGLAFIGTQKTGPFDIEATFASELLSQRNNPNGRPNSDVVRPWLNGSDIVGRPSKRWIIDFGTDMPFEAAAEYEAPFEYVRREIYPKIAKGSSTESRNRWWLFTRPRPAMRAALNGFRRYIATPRVAKHRVFVFVDVGTVPDSRIVVIAREDDYFLGVLHSRIHTAWSLATASRHGVGNDPTYNAESCFETFAFPWSPTSQQTADPRVNAISVAANELVGKRDVWMNSEGATEAELKGRTLTNLYNDHPTWLEVLHKKLDEAVFAAYGWPNDLTDDEILVRLLTLNRQRAEADTA